MLKSVAIVYGVYINSDADWRKLIRAQLRDLKRSSVLSISDLHVVVTNPKFTPGVSEFFEALPIDIKSIKFSNENRFEFPAISRVWELAHNNENYNYISYLHTKGMSYAKTQRNRAEKYLTNLTFSNWRTIITLFEEQPMIQKVGLFPAEGGWVWYNFWWARAGYVRTLPQPEVVQNRYYYEAWLGSSSNVPSAKPWECYSLFTGGDCFYSIPEATDGLRFLQWKRKYTWLFPLRNAFSSKPISAEVIGRCILR